MKTTSEFMDKQILELSRSHSDDFSQLLYTPEQENDDAFGSSFHLRPQRQVGSQQSRISSLQDYSSMDHNSAGDSKESALISVIGRKMNQHFDNLMHAVEGLSARLTQLETRLRLVENSVDDLKDSTEINHGRTDGKLRQLENIMREVEGGMQNLRDKQEISEAQLQLARFQMMKDQEQLQNRTSNAQATSAEGVLSSTPQQSHQPHSSPVASIPLPSLPANGPPTIPHQYFPPAPAAQLPNQSPQNQIPSMQHADSNYSAPVLNPQPAHHMYYMPPVEQSQPPPTAPYQLYALAPHPSLASQVQQLPQLHQPLNPVDPQAKFSSVHNSGETPYMLSQSYPPNRQTSNAPGLALPTQQQYMGSFQYTHNQSTSHHPPEFPPGHFQPGQHSTFDDLYSHNGSPSHNSGSKMKLSQVLPASLDHSDKSSFIQGLPTAKVLPYALPMASSVDKESSSGGTGNRIPIDNVIDKVVLMGFRRDVVRATVRKMTENGQSVDLNVVLDKLMNSGEVQPQSGAFGR